MRLRTRTDAMKPFALRGPNGDGSLANMCSIKAGQSSAKSRKAPRVITLQSLKRPMNSSTLVPSNPIERKESAKLALRNSPSSSGPGTSDAADDMPADARRPPTKVFNCCSARLCSDFQFKTVRTRRVCIIKRPSKSAAWHDVGPSAPLASAPVAGAETR